MIIDKILPEYGDVPHSLEGECLLERTYTDGGHLSGFITCTLDTFTNMKNADATTRSAHGWDRYNTQLDSTDVPTLQAAHDAVIARKSTTK